MNTSSNVNLSIAALQSRRRTQMFVGGALVVVLLSLVIGLFLYAPSPSEQTKPIALDPKPLGNDNPQPAGALIQDDPSEKPELDEDFLSVVAALSEDPVHGSLASEIAKDIEATGRTSATNKQKLLDMAAARTSELNKALEQAMKQSNVSLLRTLTESKFFTSYGKTVLPHWVWVTTPAFEEYESLASALARAEGQADRQGVLDALVSIKALTAYSGFDGQVRDLKKAIAEDREAAIKNQLLSLMTSEEYQKVLDLADDNQPILTGDQELQNLVKQARVALSKTIRDDLFADALKEARDDDWESAVATLSRIPRELRVADINQLETSGKKILSIKRTLVDLAGRPDRLTDESVESYARKQITAAEEFTPLSASLVQLVSQLNGLIEKASETVRVEIESDNKAKILIPRMGYIEPTTQKILNLKRAKYRFIVRCEGEQDAFEDVDLRATSLTRAVKIRLICEG